MTEAIVPPEFELLPTGLGFTDAIAPCYRRVSEAGVSFGLIGDPGARQYDGYLSRRRTDDTGGYNSGIGRQSCPG